jgi:hypothetical protein
LFDFTKPLTESQRRCLLSRSKIPRAAIQDKIICYQSFPK